MRCLERNKTPFYYALFDKTEEVTDRNGYKTGEVRVLYQKPVLAKANISAAKGDAQIEQFGSALNYDKVMVIGDMDCPIDENTILFVDTIPKGRRGHYKGHDYIVAKIARSLNTLSIAISKVETG